jgi:hypothetical protein
MPRRKTTATQAHSDAEDNFEEDFEDADDLGEANSGRRGKGGAGRRSGGGATFLSSDVWVSLSIFMHADMQLI